MQNRLFVAVALASAVLAVGPTGAAAASIAFTATDLGTLGGSFSHSVGITDEGQVVGQSLTETFQSHGFSWTAAGGMIDIGTLGGPQSLPVAVSAGGQIVGRSGTSSGLLHGFSWTVGAGIIDLGTLGGTTSWPLAVNAAGTVVGWSLTESGQTHAFKWTPSTGMADLGSLGGTFSSASGINAAGVIVGVSGTASGEGRAFRWTPQTGMTDIGGGIPGEAVAINDSGQIAGTMRTPTGGHAFSWSEASGVTDLGTLGGSFSRAFAVGPAGHVVGTSSSPSGPRAFVWTASTGVADIGPGEATDVNGRGQVVGSTSGFSRASFFWSASDGLIDLGPLTSPNPSVSVSLNEHGEVAGSTNDHATLWTPIGDTTPPTLELPTALAVDATSPAGARVLYTATATDDSGAVPVLACTPASGSTFAIGDTAVECMASDTAENTSTGTFHVHVRGTEEQLLALERAVVTLGPGTSLSDKIKQTRVFVGERDVRAACLALDSFLELLKAQTGKKIDASTSTTLIADASRVRTVLAC